MVRTSLLFVFRRIARIYFRDVEVAGDRPGPDTGGRLFAANHVNGLVDPILVLTQAPCPISPVAKSTLWQIPGLRWLLDAADAVPIVRRRDVPGKSASDNEAVFARVADHLTSGGNILIFPEGTSHNEPHLLELRGGAGRMLARARAQAGDEALTFQSVALEFDERDVFRSRALVLFGPVRRVTDLPGTGPELGDRITELLRRDLSELLLEGATWDERILLVRLAEMFAEDDDDRSLERRNAVGRRIEEARRVLVAGAPSDVAAIEERLRAYAKRLASEGTTDPEVARIARGGPVEAVGGRRVIEAAAIVAAPLALVAVLVYALPYRLPRFVARKLAADPDVASTYKLGVGLVVYPAWATAAIALAFVYLSPALAILAAAVILACPFAALPWLDRWDRLAVRSTLLAPSEERRARLVDLAQERAALMRDVSALGERAAR